MKTKIKMVKCDFCGKEKEDKSEFRLNGAHEMIIISFPEPHKRVFKDFCSNECVYKYFRAAVLCN